MGKEGINYLPQETHMAEDTEGQSIREVIDKYGPITDRFVLRLGKEDGEFDPWHTGPADFQEDFEGFLDALSLHRSVHMTNERMKDQKRVRKEIRKKLKEEAQEAEKQQRKDARAALFVANREKKAADKEAAKVARKTERAALKAELGATIGYSTDKSITEAALNLSAQDAKVFVEAMINSSEPNEALKEAVNNARADSRLAGLPDPFPIIAVDMEVVEERFLASLPEEKILEFRLNLPEEK